MGLGTGIIAAGKLAVFQFSSKKEQEIMNEKKRTWKKLRKKERNW